MTQTTQHPSGIANSAFEFLTGAFNSKNIDVIALAGDASMRRYYRIIFGDKSYVLMDWEPFESPKTFPFLSVLAHFEKHNVGVPEVIQMDSKLGLILLEDLGDLTLERKFWENQDQSQSLPFYFQAVDELIKIHFSATEDRNLECHCFQVQFNTDKFLWEMNYARKNLLENFYSLKLNDVENRSLDKVFLSICETLHQQPKRISHRDYHSRNLMLKMGKMRVIDFQDARLGPVQYDLVSLIHDSYVKLSSKSETLILQDYLTKAREHGFSPPADEFQKIYQLQILQRCFKACGSFSSFFNLREDTRYLKYIRPTMIKIMNNLEHFPDYREFLSILKDHNVLDKNVDELCAP